jgi:hypothetical protein
MHIEYWKESQKERDHQEDQDLGGWIVFKLKVGKIGLGRMDWIDLALNRAQQRSVLNTV